MADYDDRYKTPDERTFDEVVQKQAKATKKILITVFAVLGVIFAVIGLVSLAVGGGEDARIMGIVFPPSAASTSYSGLSYTRLCRIPTAMPDTREDLKNTAG